MKLIDRFSFQAAALGDRWGPFGVCWRRRSRAQDGQLLASAAALPELQSQMAALKRGPHPGVGGHGFGSVSRGVLSFFFGSLAGVF